MSSLSFVPASERSLSFLILRILGFAIHIAVAVADIHGWGVIHKDLKKTQFGFAGLGGQ
jgi:hypothetical protein